MKIAYAILVAAALFLGPVAWGAGDVSRDILVTFHDDAASPVSGSIRAPYRARQRYSISASARRNATAIAREYDLETVEHWPIRALGVYCYVYRPASGTDRQALIERLNADERVESAQALQAFNTSTANFNDQYATLQRGLTLIDVNAAHTRTRGAGIRVAIIDSAVDVNHEDLDGQLDRILDFSADNVQEDLHHGTAVASVIGARTNNQKGIAGIAPDATIDLLVACWQAERGTAVCNSFSLARALDALFDDLPHIVNMSLTGPDDPLLGRLLDELHRQGVVIVAACAALESQGAFPAGRESVIGVASETSGNLPGTQSLQAPGEQIMVAVPGNQYDFKSGSSLAAAHVSGVAALLLSVNPELTPQEVSNVLALSQRSGSGLTSVNACVALGMGSTAEACEQIDFSELYSGAE